MQAEQEAGDADVQDAQFKAHAPRILDALQKFAKQSLGEADPLGQ